MKKYYFMSFVLLFLLLACKKNDITINDSQQIATNPILRIDARFPNGVLKFDSKKSFQEFITKVEDDKDYVIKIIPEFKSFRVRKDEFYANIKKSKNQRSTEDGNTPLIVDTTEFLFDLNEYSLPTSSFGEIVNDDMEVIVGNTLCQFTRIGLFKVDLTNLEAYSNLFDANIENIYYDNTFTSMPNEVALNDNEYQVATGIVREPIPTGDILNERLIYMDDNGGLLDTGGGSGGSPTPQNDYYVNSTVDESFQKEVGIVFNDWAKRRLVFKTQNTNIGFSTFGFHKIDIKAKIQREKKFLWFTYWGPSFADEIIVGCDNMSLETSFIFPHPQQFSSISRPTFEGLADFKIGNHIVKALNLRINLSAMGYTFSNNEMSNIINDNFNSLVGNVYNNAFKAIETKILNNMDVTYNSSFANYTTKVNKLNEENRLKWTIGKTEKVEGYSHNNEWVFDYNLGGSYTQNGGVGGYPLQYTYTYTMKGGSFFGRARVGNVWHGIRIIRQ